MSRVAERIHGSGEPEPRRTTAWRVEWRKLIDRPLRPFLILAREMPGAAEARAFALNHGNRAWGGEFRLTASGVEAGILDLRRLREWDPSGPMPYVRDTIWAEDLRRAAARDELNHAMRDAASRAAEAGVISLAEGLALVRLFAARMAC